MTSVFINLGCWLAQVLEFTEWTEFFNREKVLEGKIMFSSPGTDLRGVAGRVVTENLAD